MNVQPNIMVFCEQREGQVHPISFELLSKSREIADRLGIKLSAVLLGEGIIEKTEELIQYGADTVFVYDHPSLREYDLLNYRHNLVELVKEQSPEIILFGATNLGRSLAPRVAVALNTGLTADCIGLDIDEDGNLIQIRPAFTGNILAWIKTSTRPQMATVRYKVLQTGHKDFSRKGKVIHREFQPVPSLFTIIGREKMEGIDISNADIIVSGGRGLKKPEDFSLLTELAYLVGGVIGSSRPLVDEGWISREHQVGFSGNTVKPKFYIACGISGSAQHMAGMRGADIIVAINIDPSAPIFRIADYGIVGDLYEVVPRLTEEIRKRRGK